MTLKDYLTVLRERWFLVVIGTLVGLGLGSSVAFLSTPQYAASTNFFVASRDAGGMADINQAYQGSLLSEQKMKSYLGLAEGRKVREQVSARLGSPVDAGVIKASARPDTVLLTITATDPSPRRAQAIANLTASTFADLVAELERPETGDAVVVAKQFEEAPLPTVPVSPKQKTCLALGFLLGLMAGMTCAVLRHALDRSVKSPEVLAEIAEAPVLGFTQWDPAIKTRPLIVHDQPRAPIAEAFRQLRTNLEYVDLDHTKKLICITSSLPHEGKTTTACNLAIALAQAGNRVALVEADLRRPKAADYLGVENAVGLTTVLTGQVSLDVALQPWGGGLMDFLGCGALPPNPSELLASAQMSNVLKELEARYDVVILDAAPVLPVADAPALAAQCHGVVLVARHGWVKAEQVLTAVETIRRVSAPLFGVVLSMAPRSKAGNGYGYGYGYTYTSRGEPTRTSATRPTAAVQPRSFDHPPANETRSLPPQRIHDSELGLMDVRFSKD